MAGEQAKGAIAGGAVTAALILGVLAATRTAGAAPPGSTLVTLDDSTMQTLVGILQREEFIDTDVQTIIAVLNDLKVNLDQLVAALNAIIGMPGAIANPKTGVAWRTACPAATTAYQLPARVIPNDKQLVIKAAPNNAGNILVAFSAPDATNPNSSYLLIANEAIMYKIANSNAVWISATNAGDAVFCTAEQEV